MTGGEQELLEKYLTHLKFPGVDGSYPDLETWYKEVRCARGQPSPDLGVAYKDIQDAARIFNRCRKQPKPSPGAMAKATRWPEPIQAQASRPNRSHTGI